MSAVRSYSFVVLGDAWPAICWACSSVPPFDRYAVIGLFAGGGEILRLARPASRSSGFRMQGPSGPAPAAGPDHRLLGDGGVVPPAGRVPRQGDVWLARPRRYGDMRKALLSAPAVADADRSPPAPASPHDWLAERRFAEGPAPAGRRGAGRCGRWRKHRRQRAPRREDGNRRAGRGRRPSTGGCPRRGRANSWRRARTGTAKRLA